MSEFDRYADDLRRAAEGLDEDAEAAVTTVGRGALAVAKSRAPVLTGTLRDELHLIQRGSVAMVVSSLDYSIFPEFGTSTMAPQPFIQPAAAWGEVRLVREVEEIRDDVAEVLG